VLISIGSPASPGGSLQIRLGPVPSLNLAAYTGLPIVAVKGTITTPSLAGSVTRPGLRGAITTPAVVGTSEA